MTHDEVLHANQLIKEIDTLKILSKELDLAFIKASKNITSKDITIMHKRFNESIVSSIKRRQKSLDELW